MWPPCSPDFNLLDFSLWAYLEKTVCLKKHTGIEFLKKDLERAWENISQQMLRVICDDVPKQLKDVIENNGGQIE